MQLRSSNKAVLGVESLDNRVMPSVGVTLPLEVPATVSVQVSDAHESQVMEALKKIKIDASAFSISVLSGDTGRGPVGDYGALHGNHGGVVTQSITRSSGEEIPQTV
jgi:hypothetical protein